MKTLNIIETAYRATIEEQDDPIVWLTHAMKGAGADLSVLLRGNAVNYVAKGQDASGLRFGDWTQTHPPEIDHDVASLVGKGVAVYVLAGDLVDRGIAEDDVIAGVERIDREALPKLFAAYDRVWHW